MWNTFLYAVIPYLAVAIAVVGGIWRYRTDRFSYSSQSSQFLESRALFWGSVAWHYGILFVLGAHVLALMFWDPWAVLVSNPTRLYVLEVIGLALSLLAFVGLAVLIVRRLTVRRVRAVTTPMDWVLLVALAAQVALGIWIALGYRWGSEWYVHTAVPWLHSLIKLNPKPEYMVSLPDDRAAARHRRLPADRPLPVHPARPRRDRARHVSLALLPGRRVEPASGAVAASGSPSAAAQRPRPRPADRPRRLPRLRARRRC